MPGGWEEKSVSIAMLHPHPLPYAVELWNQTFAAAAQQDGPVREVIVVDNRGLQAGPLPPGTDRRVVHLPGAYPNRAAMLNASMAAATGDYILVLVNDVVPVMLRRFAVRVLLMAAERAERAGMVYADYELLEPDGRVTTRHLLHHHPGRLRETTDYGRALLFPARLLRGVGGFDDRYTWADVYDLRLRIAEQRRLVHVADRHSGALCTVASRSQAHNVFDYLLAERESQVEHEKALTEHLRRIGAYLPGDRPRRTITYTPEDEQRFAACTASVVIPVHRRPEFIGAAIRSALNQTRRDVETIVVVNGGEDDPTIGKVRRYMEGGDRWMPGQPEVRLLVVDVNNIGLCLNLGIAAARGKYYVQLDSDDRLKSDAVAQLAGVFESDPAIGMVIGAYEVWDLNRADGTLSRNPDIPVVDHREWTDENGPNNLLRVNGAGAPRAAHIKVLKELGWFGVNDSPYCRNYGEDYDLILRVSEHYRIGRVWEPIYEVIRHPGGTDHSIDPETIDRNDNAKDFMRWQALRRRQRLNGVEPIGADMVLG